MTEIKTNYFRGLGGFRGFSSSVLKIIAITTMLIDHVGVVLFPYDNDIFRTIGRIAFPLFAFMIAEGAKHTSDIKKYALRLLLFAFVSEIPYDMAFGSGYFDFSMQNVYFTLLAGLCAIGCIKYFRSKKTGFLGIFTTLVFAVASMLIEADYGFTGVLVIVLMYLASDSSYVPKIIVFALCTVLTTVVILPELPVIFIAPQQIYAVMAVVPMMLYNNEKGFKINRYFFYAFYPGHIIILALIKMFI